MNADDNPTGLTDREQFAETCCGKCPGACYVDLVLEN